MICRPDSISRASTPGCCFAISASTRRRARSSACLREAGETRTEDELVDNATWSSYDQFRRLLEVTADVVRRRRHVDHARPAAA